MSVNFQRLLDVCRATESHTLDRFDMSVVRDETSCGTVGCLIGHYNAMISRKSCDRDLDTFGHHVDQDHDHFGISPAEYTWLFDYCVTICGRVIFARSLGRVTRDEALSRLRKFIAYKQRKHAMIHDDKYGVSDASRHAEGDQNFVMLAVQDSKVALSLAAAV